jgi:hypothetical protein
MSDHSLSLEEAATLLAGRNECNVQNATSLRRELSFRNQTIAKSEKLLHALTDGLIPSVIFGESGAGKHGNFHPASYQCIRANAAWASRLGKVHTAYQRMQPRADWKWMELDCANSSDALLMNIFCHPDVFADGRVSALLGTAAEDKPEFGFKPRVPLHGEKSDRTEIDMKLGDLYVEAKLTETNFQHAKPSLLRRYRDLAVVFEGENLPTTPTTSEGYQLVRCALAAYAANASFCVLCDDRRPDLIEAWYRVLRAVRSGEFRWKLKLLTWQELASVLPNDLRSFLARKYGIIGSSDIQFDAHLSTSATIEENRLL